MCGEVNIFSSQRNTYFRYVHQKKCVVNSTLSKYERCTINDAIFLIKPLSVIISYPTLYILSRNSCIAGLDI
jgi:hypothetical protein